MREYVSTWNYKDNLHSSLGTYFVSWPKCSSGDRVYSSTALSRRADAYPQSYRARVLLRLIPTKITVLLLYISGSIDGRNYSKCWSGKIRPCCHTLHCPSSPYKRPTSKSTDKNFRGSKLGIDLFHYFSMGVTVAEKLCAPIYFSGHFKKWRQLGENLKKLSDVNEVI